VPLAGVIGWPIAHSRSPRLHGHWLGRHGIVGGFVPLAVAPEDLRLVLEAMPRMGFVGTSVTLPHKQAVAAHCRVIEPAARRIGAINMLTFTADGIHGANTDAPGFIAALAAGAGFRAHGLRAALIGTGGAARAIAVALADEGLAELRVVGRRPDATAEIAALFGAGGRSVAWSNRADALDGVDLLVQATSLGMTGKEPLDLPLDRLATTALVCDIVYSPRETALLATAAGRGNPTVDGVGMLLHQAVPAFARWFGVTPAVDAALLAAVLG
jgi:shikimate dehydrogenase